MVNTLRITSVVAGILAVALLSFSTVFGIQKQGDPEVTVLLKTPSAVEVFKKAHGQQPSTQKDQTPPLVVQAKKYTYVPLPPHPVVKTQRLASRRPHRVIAAQPPVSAKFELMVTSYLPSNPSQSCVLVKETGGRYRWLNIGDSIGHQVVKDIQDSKLILKQADGDALETLEIPQQETQHLLDGNYPNEPEQASAAPLAGAPHLTPGQSLNPVKVRPMAPTALRVRRALDRHRKQVIRQHQALSSEDLQQLQKMRKQLADLKAKDMGQSPEAQKKNAKTREEIMKLVESRIKAQRLQRGETAPHEEPPGRLPLTRPNH